MDQDDKPHQPTDQNQTAGEREVMKEQEGGRGKSTAGNELQKA